MDFCFLIGESVYRLGSGRIVAQGLAQFQLNLGESRAVVWGWWSVVSGQTGDSGQRTEGSGETGEGRTNTVKEATA